MTKPSTLKQSTTEGSGLLPAHLAILAVFFVQALANGGMFPRIPDIQQALSLSKGQLGVLLTAPAIGGLISFTFASRVVERIGTKPILLIGIPANALAAIAIGAVQSETFAFPLFMLFGASFAFTNVAMNVEADRIEAQTGIRVMNRCHGYWSLGLLAASLIGTFAKGAGVSPLMHFIGVLPVVLLAIALVVYPMHAARLREHKGQVKTARFPMPTRKSLMLVGFGAVAVMSEGVVRSWSVIFMRDNFAAPDWVDTLTLPAFLLMLFAGRMFADAWVDRFGARRVAMTLLGIALAGLLLAASSLHLLQALLGFALMGVGISVIYPLTISAAAQIGDRPASENVAAFTLITSLLMLAAPPMIGEIAEHYGIRNAMLVLVPMYVLALALAPKVVAGRTAKAVDK